MPGRPRNPTGFVRRHPGTEAVRWQAILKYPDPDDPSRWRTRSATFVRKSEAQAWLDRTLAEHRACPDWRPPSEETLGAFMERWLGIVASQVRPSALRSYRQMARHAQEQLGHVPLVLLSHV
jgi:hypothetical protein